MRAILVDAHQAALDAVSGRPAVARYLRSVSGEQRPTHAAAVGKAAADMMAGALDVLGDQLRDALVITKHGHSTGLAEYLGTIRVIESAHPVPDASCLQAGEALWRFVHDAPKDAPERSTHSDCRRRAGNQERQPPSGAKPAAGRRGLGQGIRRE